MGKQSQGILSGVGGSLSFGTQAKSQMTIIVGSILIVLGIVVGYFFGKPKKRRRR